MHKIFICFAVFGSIFSCSSGKQFVRITDSNLREAQKIPSEHLRIRLKPIHPLRMRKPEVSDAISSKCRFESIPGGFWGETNYRSFNEYSVDGANIAVDLSPKVFDGRLEISPMRRNVPKSANNLNVSPSDAKFALVATMCDKYFSGFASELGKALSLMYFDRPAQITGDISMDGYVTKYNLSIPSAGFYFIEFASTDEKHHSADGYYTGPNVYYFLLLGR
jgi:hypothetical protein